MMSGYYYVFQKDSSSCEIEHFIDHNLVGTTAITMTTSPPYPPHQTQDVLIMNNENSLLKNHHESNWLERGPLLSPSMILRRKRRIDTEMI